MLLSLLGKNADHADAAFGCSDQSLSLVSQVSSSLAHGSSKLSPFTRELLPQPLCGRQKIVTYLQHLQSGCDMREPEGRSCNTTEGRVGTGREHASDSDELPCLWLFQKVSKDVRIPFDLFKNSSKRKRD